MTPLINRIRIYIDFWNFELSCKEFSTKTQAYKIDWRKLPQVLCRQVHTQMVAEQNIGPGYTYEGTYVYVSYGPKDEKLQRWAENTLETFPGYTVIAHDRVPKSSQKCPQCKEFIVTCPHCQVILSGTTEKGVDTRLAVDMISAAWDNMYDTAVLVSSDRDFVPAVRMLGRRGKKIFQVGIPPRGVDLASACWDTINLDPIKDKIRRDPLPIG